MNHWRTQRRQLYTEVKSVKLGTVYKVTTHMVSTVICIVSHSLQYFVILLFVSFFFFFFFPDVR